MPLSLHVISGFSSLIYQKMFAFSNHPFALEMYKLLKADSHGHLIKMACFGLHPQYEVDKRRVPEQP